MLNKMKNNQGFTLIELLIVVAIIGILAAIAIPQFSAYRIKGFNTAAVSDLKNGKTAQESLFADNQTYGWSETGLATLGAAVGTGGSGALIIGPVGPAPVTAVAGVTGAAYAGKRNDGTVAAIGVQASNGVIMAANTTAVNAAPAYVLCSKHTQGSRVYAAESATTAVMFVQNDTAAFVGVAMSADTGTPATGVPALASVTPTITTATAGGGSPTANWSAM
jgi:type IV pilus assembly protein PilA